MTSQSHCAQASATVLSQDQVNLSLEGATWSFVKYHSKFGLYGVKSVIARSKLSFSYGYNGGTLKLSMVDICTSNNARRQEPTYFTLSCFLLSQQSPKKIAGGNAKHLKSHDPNVPTAT